MADERELQMQKRRKWMEERELEQKLTSIGYSEQVLQDDKGKLLADITLKLTEKFKAEMNKNDKALNHDEIKIEKAISKEIESNTCPICLDLMLPPQKSPILLFPCGHTFCKSCINSFLQQNKKKCPCCRATIGSQAVNISLQNLICIHTNNKHLLDKYTNLDDDDDEEEEDRKKNKNKGSMESLEKYQQEFQLYEMRYKIVKEERKETQKIIQELQKSYQVQGQVIKELEKNKEEVLKKLEAVKKELSLVEEFISQSEKEGDRIAKQLEESETKLQLIDSTLIPIQQEKEKYELLVKSLKGK